jgi:uncharacterized repeat protein (TIGR03803 family)
MDSTTARTVRHGGVAAGLCCAFLLLLSACDGGDGPTAEALGTPDPIAESKFDGTSPNGLILGRDGNLYGTTFFGGDFGFGTVFRITPGGTETVLHSFAGGPDDGANPQGLIQASDGNLYGTTGGGGRPSCPRAYAMVLELPGARTDHSGCGTVFKLTPRGEETLLHFFSGGAGGKQPIPGLVETGGGNFYGATSYGGLLTSTTCGEDGCGVVFRITADGTESTLYSFDVDAGDGRFPVGLTLGQDGSLYGTTQVGGRLNQGTVFKVTTTGTETVLYHFRGISVADGGYPNGPLVLAGDGNFYGTTQYGGDSGDFSLCEFGCGTLFRITPPGIETVLYSFGNTANGVLPRGALIVGGDGNLYGTTSYGGDTTICRPGCGTVFKSTLSGTESAIYRFGPTSLQVPTTFALPSNLVSGRNGNVYGTAGGGEFGEGIIFIIDPNGQRTILHSFRGRT